MKHYQQNADIEIDEDGVGGDYHLDGAGNVIKGSAVIRTMRDPATWQGHRSLKRPVRNCFCALCCERVAIAPIDCVARLSTIAADLRGGAVLTLGQTQDLLEGVDEIEQVIKEMSVCGGRSKAKTFAPARADANATQVGGQHYKGKIEPWDAISAWGLGFLAGSVIKYVARYKKKNGVEDLKKARHFLDKLIERNGEELDE